MMREAHFAITANQLPVRGFIHFSPTRLADLKHELSLYLSVAGLQLVAKQFAAELRDPTVGELRFLDALSRTLAALPQSTQLTELHFAEKSDARIWQDICRDGADEKQAAAPTLASVTRVSAMRLAKAGHLPTMTELHVAAAPDMALTTFTAPPALSLEVDGTAAALTETATVYPPLGPGQILLALSADSDASLATTVTRFLRTYAALSPVPLAVIGEEGLGAHLSALPCGAEFDLCRCSDKTDGDPATLATRLRHTVIFAVPQAVAHQILTGGAPVLLIGRLMAGDRIVFRDEPSVLMQFSRQFLCLWQSRRALSLHLPTRPCAEAPSAVIKTENDKHLLAGTSAKLQNALPSLTELLARVYLTGARMATATLAAFLSVPQGNEGEALALALDWHRFTAELALPTTDIKLQGAAKGTTPTLTVFCAAERAPAPEPAEREALAVALAHGDFAALRQVMYQKML